MKCVDQGQYDLAISLATGDDGSVLCRLRAEQVHAPKSTWFDPKIRSGMVMAQLD